MRRLLGAVFGMVVGARALLYRRGLLPSRSLEDPVISVGNLSLGGTGKTPLVACLARLLSEAGWQPAVLSRGYRSPGETKGLLVSDGARILCRPEDCGDEPFLLARRLKGVAVAVGSDRRKAWRKLPEPSLPRVVLLDDAYQHLRLKRDLNILVVDATDPFGGGLLPAGRLREPLAAMRRADWIILSRCHQREELDSIEAAIRQWNPLAPIWRLRHRLVSLVDARTQRERPLSDLVGRPVVVLAGIGTPRNFLEDVEAVGIPIAAHRLFRDHHWYRQEELDQVLSLLRPDGPRHILTTEKDAVRLSDLGFCAGRILALRIEAEALEPEPFRKALLAALGK